MQQLRMLVKHKPTDDKDMALTLAFPVASVPMLIQGLASALGQRAKTEEPGEGKMEAISMTVFGQIEQHVQGWVPALDVPGEVTVTAKPDESPRDDDRDEQDDE